MPYPDGPTMPLRSDGTSGGDVHPGPVEQVLLDHTFCGLPVGVDAHPAIANSITDTTSTIRRIQPLPSAR